MQASLTHAGRTYAFDPTRPLDISLPLAAGLKGQPNCFWAEPVEVETIRVGDFVGSVALGGSTNYQRVHLTPHGNGTHTECYGHLSPDPAATLDKCLTQFLFVAQLLSVAPRAQENGDLVVLLADVQAALASTAAFPTPPSSAEGGRESLLPPALILRTLPNDEAKRARHYSGTNPPYLEPALAEFLVESHVQHLLLDLPSVDREQDGGQLLAHHAFWRYPAAPRRGATITELIFVPDAIPDGLYLLNLQVTSLVLDASPSKPVLYALREA
ncbi:cyclase family protein [uncultured Hymenobacter sp.]|uniref:cyclase family protein n=1 Tax=uncultured Hymenobacter sp. TaxID=170016 RepID=UPI0035CC5BC1